MPARDPAVREAAARLAAEERHHPDDDHSDLRCDLRTARAAEYVRSLRDLPLDRRADLARELLTGAGDAT